MNVANSAIFFLAKLVDLGLKFEAITISFMMTRFNHKYVPRPAVQYYVQFLVTHAWGRLNTVWLMTSVAMERMLDSFYEHVRVPSSHGGVAPDTGFMKTLCGIYELKHSAYITVDKRSFSSRKPKYLVTYPAEWQEEYRRSFAERKDPVIQAGLTELLPFDWRMLMQRHPMADGLLGAAREFGVGRQGLTIPIRGENGARALFTVTSDYNDKDWDDFNRKYRKDFIILANYFHKKITGTVDSLGVNLSEREKEVLQLCCFGMTALDISKSLQISVATVKYFLNQVRYKLDTLNTTQSVAKALKLGLIV